MKATELIGFAVQGAGIILIIFTVAKGLINKTLYK